MIYESLTQLIGKTPLIELKNIEKELGIQCRILAKLEYFNPAGSVKDRVALNMIEKAEEKGLLKPGATVIEPTSGNTGIGLAAICAAKGYRAIFTMPETMSVERRKLLASYGAEIVLTSAGEGMLGSIKKANELKAGIPGSFIPSQFDNPDNPQSHIFSTGPEIWEDTEGNIDVFVAGIGTGGTISGTGKFLKEKNISIKIIGFEPYDSPLITEGKASGHKLQGIGANFIPETYNSDVVDKVYTVKWEDAYAMAKLIARKEGILVGITSGASVWLATELAKTGEYRDKTIVALLPDSGERYMSAGLFD